MRICLTTKSMLNAYAQTNWRPRAKQQICSTQALTCTHLPDGSWRLVCGFLSSSWQCISPQSWFTRLYSHASLTTCTVSQIWSTPAGLGSRQVGVSDKTTHSDPEVTFQGTASDVEELTPTSDGPSKLNLLQIPPNRDICSATQPHVCTYIFQSPIVPIIAQIHNEFTQAQPPTNTTKQGHM